MVRESDAVSDRVSVRLLAGALGETARTDARLWVALMCHWLWFTITCLGPLRLPFAGSFGSPMPSWGLTLAAVALVCGAVAASAPLRCRVTSRRSLAVGCGVFFIGILLSTIWLVLPADAPVSVGIYTVGAVLMGVGNSLVLLYLLNLYSFASVKLILVHGALAMACATCIQVAILLVGFAQLAMVVSLTAPLVQYVCLHRVECGGQARAARVPLRAPAPMRPHGKVMFTLFVPGLAMGFGLGILHIWGDAFMPQRIAASVSTGVASALLVVFALMLKTDFIGLVYRIGFPLMAGGFLLMSCSKDFLAAGSILLATGFSFQYMVSLCLLIFIARSRGASAVQWAGRGLCCLAAGQLAGGLLGISLVVGQSAGQAYIATTASIISFALLMVALFASINNAPGEKGRWETVQPGVSEMSFGMAVCRVRSLARACGLTPRETDVCELAAQGRNKRAIARELCVSEETAKAHLKSVYQKLGVHSLQELIDRVQAYRLPPEGGEGAGDA